MRDGDLRHPVEIAQLTVDGVLAKSARLGVGDIRKAAASATATPVDEATERSLAGQWSSIEDALYRALESRAEEVTTRLDRRLRERAEFEANSVATLLNDLKRNIEAELKELEGESGRQLRLQFTSDDERVQLEQPGNIAAQYEPAALGRSTSRSQAPQVGRLAPIRAVCASFDDLGGDPWTF